MLQSGIEKCESFDGEIIALGEELKDMSDATKQLGASPNLTSHVRNESDDDDNETSSQDDTTHILEDSEVLLLQHHPLSEQGKNNSKSGIEQGFNLVEHYSYQPLDMSDYMYLLGKAYHLRDDTGSRKADEDGLLYFSYRNNFPEILPYGYTSDAGWGCMLRASQMLLAQALKVHYRGRNWTNIARGYGASYLDEFVSPVKHFDCGCCGFSARKSELSDKRQTPCKHRVRGRAGQDEKFYADLLTWFADHPGMDTRFSLHNMVSVGFKFEMLPGEWYGPGTACYVLRDLCRMYEQTQYRKRLERLQLLLKLLPNRQSSTNEISENEFVGDISEGDIFRVVVAQEGTIVRSVIDNIMTESAIPKDEKVTVESDVSKKEKDLFHEESTKISSETNNLPNNVISDPLFSPKNDNTALGSKRGVGETSCRGQIEWDRPMLLMIPLRLGLSTFNKDSYGGPLSRTLGLSQSVGFLGGSPRHALWFYGANANGSQLYGLDPHTVQPSPQRDPNRYGAIMLSKEYQSSVASVRPVPINMNHIDPSIALGFYCRDREDFERLVSSLERLPRPGEARLLSIIDSAPEYDGSLSKINERSFRSDSSSKIDDDADISSIGSKTDLSSPSSHARQKSETRISIGEQDEEDDEDFVFL